MSLASHKLYYKYNSLSLSLMSHKLMNEKMTV